MGRDTPAEIVDGLDDRGEVLRRHHREAVEGAALAVVAGERLRHVPAFEAAIDQELDAAHAHPLVALVLLEGRLGDHVADARRIAGAEARQVDGVAQRQLAGAARGEDRVERLEELALVAPRDAHAGDAVGVHLALGGEHVLDRDGGGRRQRHQALGVVDELAGQRAVGAAGDGAALRHRGVLRDVPVTQRRRVEDVVVAAAHQHHGVCGRDTVELGRERQALLLELGLVPVGIADDEVAGLRRCHRLADRRDEVGERARRRQIDAAAAALVVEMPVGETRHHEAPARVDDLRVRPDAGPDRGGRTDGDEFAVLDGERLGRRRALARGEHLGVDDHEVRGLGERGGGETERDQDRGSRKQHHLLVSPGAS